MLKALNNKSNVYKYENRSKKWGSIPFEAAWEIVLMFR
jgi:hypothetical protein